MSLIDNTQTLDTLFAHSRLLPVINIECMQDVLPLIDALAAGGINNVEITLRTPLGLPAIELLRRERPAIGVGAGTVMDAMQFHAVVDAGAQFIVTPGCTDELLQLGMESPVPLLPGVATASEVLSGYRLGYRRFKLFPAQACGGIPLLEAFAGPFGDVRFCPTGGITLASATAYLALENVLCVGGTWMAPRTLIGQGDWSAIRQLAEQSAALH
ncbi:bifunctional 4-hydroxy-2-oxoglutarate aldolase/2-dehydro-3-deoxy-phosphogluconate aldolase [Halopseudomonas salina]|uniref:2-dehydro-3-deoxy-phosphogluconate aldolase n=1 Tax=Halopseudomonas salina TaxID=1323744 RepID=A0ABQ1PJX9_9GAMM|nr:bifunctional 4-hydroxy-2-oxoglutarate aldolase/2-dehydro-3-deoxy-phosphogluconate aldolase [Halopseudomonas salina]GGC98474.1 2-dehydro-3-deoxy-phosphogluconate aldolase [Halopseudomonas salina]